MYITQTQNGNETFGSSTFRRIRTHFNVSFIIVGKNFKETEVLPILLYFSQTMTKLCGKKTERDGQFHFLVDKLSK